MRNQVSEFVLIIPVLVVLLAGYLIYVSFKRNTEGFEDSSGAEVTHTQPAGPSSTAPFNADEGFSKNPIVASAQDVAEKAGPFVLGKPYDEIVKSESAPSPNDEYHLDVGGSFIAAYKKLDAGQISAMTKDTRELIETQKQLMSTLSSMKPLISDGKEMLKTFSDYFGSDMLKTTA